MGHGDDGGQVKQLQQQPLHPRLLTVLQAAGRLVQNQDSLKFSILHITFNKHLKCALEPLTSPTVDTIDNPQAPFLACHL